MQLFYAHKIEQNIAWLDQEESRHCTKTLRKKIGDSISFTDGCGKIYRGELIDVSKKSCQLNILETIRHDQDQKFRIHIAIAPTKNISRLEWFLEKTTEFGIDEISFLLCQRSERKQIRIDRLEKIVRSAAKQSLKSRFPKLNELVKFNEFVQSNDTSYKAIAHCNTDNLPHFKTQISTATDMLILIGPEGDFSEEEVALAMQQGFEETGLGSSRLRTETAGIAACHIAHLVHT